MEFNIESLYQHFLNSTGVSTDTRTIKSGQVFFALSGSNFNANEFAAKAIESGASIAVVDDESYIISDQFFLVDDVLKTLQSLANHHRKQFDIPFIGITGSNGKTTTKELMRDVLATKYNVLATEGNFNNHIGVPLTLLRITRDTEIAIIEMGANHVGEIAALCEIANPTHGLITNIGKAHLEGFGGVEGIIRGKSELYNHLIQNEGEVFVNSSDHVLSNIGKRRIKNALCYGAPGDFYYSAMIATKPYIVYESEGGERVDTQLTGGYNFQNISAALCVGKFFDVKETEANRAVAAYVPENNRSQLINKGKLEIILDAYNANPSSMKAALESIAEEEEHQTVILGDMYELGEDGPMEHEAIGSLTRQLEIDHVIFCGALMKDALKGNPDALHFEHRKDLEAYLKSNLLNPGKVLIKGSRGIGLEAILEHL